MRSDSCMDESVIREKAVASETMPKDVPREPLALDGGERMRKMRRVLVGMPLVFLAGVFALTFFLSAGSSNEMPNPAPTPPVEFVQITSIRLDAGEQIFEAFRILRNGNVEWARWNSSGFLLDHAEPFQLGSDNFDRVVSSPAFLKPPKQRRDDGALGRPAYRLEISTLTQSGIDAVFMTKMPDDLATLVDDIKNRIATTSVQSGWYIWTTPYPGQGTADIVLTEARNDSAVAIALSEAVATGRLIVRVEEDIQAFVSGEHANRIAFTARLAVGDLRFG